MKEIMERIKSRRKSLGLSFQQLADLTNMSKSTLQRYETGGIKNIPLDKLEILAKSLKTTPEWILGRDKNKVGIIMIEFFVPMIPPTVTAQEHKVTIRNGKPMFYDPPELKEAKSKILSGLYPYRPQKPFEGGLQLIVKWLFPKGNHKNGEYRITKPDTDNLQKMLKDCMTKSGFWKDDALVCSEVIEKFWAEQPGIYIRIEEIQRHID